MPQTCRFARFFCCVLVFCTHGGLCVFILLGGQKRALQNSTCVSICCVDFQVAPTTRCSSVQMCFQIERSSDHWRAKQDIRRVLPVFGPCRQLFDKFAAFLRVFGQCVEGNRRSQQKNSEFKRFCSLGPARKVGGAFPRV